MISPTITTTMTLGLGLLFHLSPYTITITTSFTIPHPHLRRPPTVTSDTTATTTRLSSTIASWSSSSPSTNTLEKLSIILYGPGDLRTSDHTGLHSAITTSSPSHKILPLVILNESSLAKLPMISSHTIDTTYLYHSALRSLDDRLSQLNLRLNVVTSSTSSMTNALQQIINEKLSDYQFETVDVHVCDNGIVDDELGYAPHSYLRKDSSFNVIPWSCALRDFDRDDILSLPDNYPEYTSQRLQGKTVISPLATPSPVSNDIAITLPSASLPSVEEMILLVQSALNSSAKKPLRNGLWGTHWGGTANGTLSEEDILDILQRYEISKDAAEEYLLGMTHRNPCSLEHAAMTWMSHSSRNNLIEGELFVRYFAAPLLFGCVSSRQLWHGVNAKRPVESGWVLPWKGSDDPVREWVEGREWHKLYAAQRLLCKNDEDEAKRYNYWRWHGFLCRYYETDETTTTTMTASSSSSDTDVVLVHGFGASGSHMTKTLTALFGDGNDSSLIVNRGYAPDLIGFGHCEKPGITYTQYLWESYLADFIKTIPKQNVVLGGNSIGGYTCMATAADDTVIGVKATASGAPGTQRVKGLVLMNSAGRILSREEVGDDDDDDGVLGVWEMTRNDLLDDCRPPPRPIARVFGNTLLSYLRPRIPSICRRLYPANPSAVDDRLTSNIRRDSLDPGAINVMMSGSKLPPPRTANELLGGEYGSDEEGPRWRGPVLVAQGMKDPLNDAVGRAGLLGGLREGIEVSESELSGAGHCPQDELPEVMAEEVGGWWNRVRDGVSSGDGMMKEEKVELSSRRR